MKFAAIIEETFREAKSRKTLVGFAIFSTIVIILTFLVLQMDAVQTGLQGQFNTKGPGHDGPPQFQGLAITVLDWVWIVICYLLFFMTVAVGVFSTASFMTSMMEKGNIDLLLSKPVPRWMYILGRYTGAMLIMAIEIVYFIIGMWLAVGISLGQWEMKFLASLVFILLGFAGIYSVVTLVSVLTRSAWFAIIIGIAAYFLSGMLAIGTFLDKLFTGGDSGGVFGAISKILYYVLPQAPELSDNMRYVITGEPIKWTPVFLTLLLVTVYLSLSSYLFSKKEF
jgi:ABC-type transport system involved in multi-copper enzyme maturation permease subunit